MITELRISSVRDVLNEISSFAEEDSLNIWAKANKALFTIPGQDEQEFTSRILAVKQFQQIIGTRSLLGGETCGRPFSYRESCSL